jgi:hypothetical protein
VRSFLVKSSRLKEVTVFLLLLAGAGLAATSDGGENMSDPAKVDLVKLGWQEGLLI